VSRILFWLSLGCLLSIVAVIGSAQDIVLPREVPSFNQAYSEGPGAWGDCPLGTLGCPDLICTTGCLVTAFSSVLAYYEVNVQVPADYSCTGEARAGMDPGIFNDWLRSQRGYGHCAQDPVGNCCLDWSRLPNQISIETHVNRSDVGLNPVAAVVIDHALRQGHPVIAGVHWGAYCNGGTSQSEDCHWVILTGKRNGDYTIIDPYNANVSSPYGVVTTLSAGVHGAYIIDRFVVVSGTFSAGVALSASIAGVSAGRINAGDPVQFHVETTGSSMVLPYARATTPSGSVQYATVRGSGSSASFRAARTSLRPSPVLWSEGWDWSIVHSADEIGTWTWELWIEAPDNPGVALNTIVLSYRVEEQTSSAGAAILGVLFVAILAAAAFFLAVDSQP